MMNKIKKFGMPRWGRGGGAFAISGPKYPPPKCGKKSVAEKGLR